MKKIILTIGLAALFMEAMFSMDSRTQNLWAADSTRVRLQVSAWSTLAGAKKEIDRLKGADIQAQYTIREGRAHKKWYVVYVDRLNTREQAVLYGNQLMQKGLIEGFSTFSEKSNKDIPIKAKETLPQPSIPSAKESKSAAKKQPVYFGPIVVKEEDAGIHINIYMTQRIFPEITSKKTIDGSRLVVTFKKIDQPIVPLKFDQIHSEVLLSFNLTAQGSEGILSLLLNPSNNYKVSQDYFEKEKIYSLRISRDSAAESTRAIEK